jgi:hypothetical protein
LTLSKKILEEKLGREILAVSLPGGSVNNEVLKTAESSGYKYVFTSIPGKNKFFKERFVFFRIPVSELYGYPYFENAVKLKSYFIFKRKQEYFMKNVSKKIIGQRAYSAIWKKYMRKICD